MLKIRATCEGPQSRLTTSEYNSRNPCLCVCVCLCPNYSLTFTIKGRSHWFQATQWPEVIHFHWDFEGNWLLHNQPTNSIIYFNLQRFNLLNYQDTIQKFGVGKFYKRNEYMYSVNALNCWKVTVYVTKIFPTNAVFFLHFYSSKNPEKLNVSWFSQKYQSAQLFSTLLIIINVSWAADQHNRMISEGSCDTEDWSNVAENSALNQKNKLHFKNIFKQKILY